MPVIVYDKPQEEPPPDGRYATTIMIICALVILGHIFLHFPW